MTMLFVSYVFEDSLLIIPTVYCRVHLLHPFSLNWIRGRQGAGYIPIISTKGINQMKKGKL